MPVSVFAPIRPPAPTIFLLAKPCGGGQSFGAILDLPGHGKAHLGIVFIRDLLCTFFLDASVASELFSVLLSLVWRLMLLHRSGIANRSGL
jgi:hypothetical protein